MSKSFAPTVAPFEPDGPRYVRGENFGKYEIVRLIGHGGMAEVYEAQHVGLRKPVALKVLAPEIASNQLLRERFLREGERAARIQHPNVVDITDLGEVNGLPFIVMELLLGEDLGELFESRGILSVEEISTLMLPIMAAVAAGHSQGVVHRDLKPDNIYLARDGRRTRPTVLDFGVSKILGDDASERLTVPNAVLGTPQYMAPEQARGDVCGPACDQYTLGLVIYEAVTGALPRESDSLLKLLSLASAGEIIPMTNHRSDLPDGFLEAVMKALALAPEDRHASMIDFAFALMPFASENARRFWETELNQHNGIADPISSDALEPLSGERTLSTARRRNTPDVTTPPNIEVKTDKSTSISTPTTLPALQLPTDEVIGAKTEEKKSSRTWMLAVLAGLVIAGGAMFSQLNRSEPKTASVPATSSVATSFRVVLHATPANAQIEMDGEVVGTGTFSTMVPKDGTLHVVRVSADGFESRDLTFKDTPPTPTVVLGKLATPPSPATSPPSAEPVATDTPPPSRPRPAATPRPARPSEPKPTRQPTPTSPATSPSPKRPKTDNRNPWE